MPRTLPNNKSTSLGTSIFHVSDNSCNLFQTENALGICSSWIKLSISQNLFIFDLYDMVLKLHQFLRAIVWDCLNLNKSFNKYSKIVKKLVVWDGIFCKYFGEFNPPIMCQKQPKVTEVVNFIQSYYTAFLWKSQREQNSSIW